MSESAQVNGYNEFLFNATTHLMQPLNEMLDSCEELSREVDGTSGNAVAQLSRQVLGQGYRLLNLINDIRDYAESQTDRMVIEKEPTDLNLLMKEVLDVASWLTKEQPQLCIKAKVPASLPHLRIHGARVQQVLLNLIHNAVKFTDSGSITVAVVPDADQVTFEIRDTGIGIAEDRQELVLAPFQTALRDSTDSRIGLGLGLPICTYLVEAHDGKLCFESTEGRGSMFTFSLPIE